MISSVQSLPKRFASTANKRNVVARGVNKGNVQRKDLEARKISKKTSKLDVTKQGLERVKAADEVVYNNLAGFSRKMKDANWKDASGKKGKGMGVYQFADKYGTNVDGYSPIYTPDLWAESGERYSLGTKGLLAWAGLLVVLLGVGINLIVSTSAA